MKNILILTSKVIIYTLLVLSVIMYVSYSLKNDIDTAFKLLMTVVGCTFMLIILKIFKEN